MGDEAGVLISRFATAGIGLVWRDGLLLPEELMALSDEQREGMGCGPGRWDWLVPDRPHGVDFHWPCVGHDWCFGDCRCGFKMANDLFAFNLRVQVLKSLQNVGRVGWYLRAQFLWAVRSWVSRRFFFHGAV